MAKRMKFSVVGLPHYTIWHLYEPSVDDLRHMAEMEEEQLAQEQKERESELAAQKQKQQSSQSKSQSNAEKADSGKVSDGSAAKPVKEAKEAGSEQAKL